LGDLNVLTTSGFHHGFTVERLVDPIYSLWRQWRFPVHWKGAHALHVPHYNIPYRYADPLVVTIHDLIHLRFAAQLGSELKAAYARYTFRQVAKRADRVLCVSEFTRRDVMERLGIDEDRALYLPNAVDERFRPTEDPAVIRSFRLRTRLPSEYLLAVGINKPHKNYPFLFEALKPLWKDGRLAPPLVVAGAGGSEGGLASVVERAGVSEWVRLLEFLPEDDMPLLYQAAWALVCPSTYEGFGLPVLEAQRVGTPVAASNAASLPEVGGARGATYFDPEDLEACRDAVLRVVDDATLRQTLGAAGHENESRYRWENSAERLVKVYRAL
jgi:glycosyltransferase involved in cell wall biosynthesis